MMEDERMENEELTSTMGNVLPATNKDDKTDTSDSTPTSSTDASTSTATAQIAVDDPISSTSEVEDKIENVTDVQMPNEPEKITENVEDIVQDLENLLGEPTTSYIAANSKKAKKIDEKGDALLDKAISMDYDEFSNEFNFSEAKSDNQKTKIVDTSSNKTEGESETAENESQNEEEAAVPETEIIENADDKQSEEISSTQKKDEEIVTVETEKNKEPEKEGMEAAIEISQKTVEQEKEEIIETPKEIINDEIEDNVENKETLIANEVEEREAVEELKIKENEVGNKTEEQEKIDLQNSEESMEIVEESSKIEKPEKIEETEKNTIFETVKDANELVMEQTNEMINEPENKNETDNISVIKNVEIKEIIDEIPKETEHIREKIEMKEKAEIVEEIDESIDFALNYKLETEIELIPDKREEIMEDVAILKERKDILKDAVEIVKEREEVMEDAVAMVEEREEIMEEAGEIVKEREEIMEEAGEIVKERDEIMEDAGEIVKERVEIMEDTGEIVKEREEIMEDTGEIVKEREEIMEDAGEIVREREEIMEDAGEIVKEREEIMKEAIKIINDNNIDETLLAVASLQNIDNVGKYVENEQMYENAGNFEEEVNRLPIEESKLVEERETIEEMKENEVKETIQNKNEKSTEIANEIPFKEFVQETNVEEVKVEEIESKKLKEPLIINVDNFDKEKSYSPKIIIKPIKEPKSEEFEDEREVNKGSLKMTITKQSDNTHSILKIYNPNEEIINTNKEEEIEERQPIPKLIIKQIPSPSSELSPKIKSSTAQQRSASPRITIKPIKPPTNENIERCVSPLKITLKQEQKHSPKLTIKPIMKTDDEQKSPKITIKPIVKPPNEEMDHPRITIKAIMEGPKITIKPIVKPESEMRDEGEEERERIVLKINKGTIPVQQQQRKRDFFEEEKLPIKLKFSNQSGNLQIIQDDDSKKMKLDHESVQNHSKLKEILTQYEQSTSVNQANLHLVEDFVMNKSSSPIVISEDSNQSSCILIEDHKETASSDLLPFHVAAQEKMPEIAVLPQEEVVVPVVVPTPRKRGRPRKVPLEVREDFKDPKEEEVKPYESLRPKRSCRGQSVRDTLGIKPRKPRGPGRGRGSKRNMGDRDYSPNKPAKEPKLSAAKLRRLKETLIEREYEENFLKTPTIVIDRADIVMYEEETRMSADTSANTSRAQTPAKQVVTSTPVLDVDESQSSVQSTATTESTKDKRKGLPRLEVHQEPEGAVISADQLAEYYWSGGGPYMLQEQVAQFLGIKSFKRKYPNIQRRFVDMQERDFIRESGLACEAMCDLGLTAVNSADILDIMYSDFQDKYEEYCKHQRDRQAKDLTNKQKALSLTLSQEKTKMDIMQQAVQSSATWNTNFNKVRNDQRKASMDLQTLTIHYPKGTIKQINKPKLGHYPVALVPGQFTDYFKEFTPDEINNLPLNTLCYGHVNASLHEDMEIDSQTDGSGSESDSSSSGSDSSFSGSSDGEDCTLCKTTSKKLVV